MILLGDSLLGSVTPPNVPFENNVITHVESISGCTIQRLTNLLRERELNHLLENQTYVIIVIGTNNLAREHSKTAITKLKNFIILFHKLYPSVKMTLAKVPYRTKTSVFIRAQGDNGGKSIVKRVNLFNERLVKLQRRLKRKISFEFDLFDFELSKSQHLSKDGLHPNKNGFKHMSQKIQEYVDKMIH